MLSKFIGIKVISEMEPHRRAVVLLGLIGVAEVALLLFAVVPPSWGAVFLFVNGLPLGMVFGLVLLDEQPIAAQWVALGLTAIGAVIGSVFKAWDPRVVTPPETAVAAR